MTERIPSQPPEIKPLQGSVSRPKWSVMIPAYNCRQYLIEKIRSVLEQDPGEENMQIEVVDDGSTDADVESWFIKSGKEGFDIIVNQNVGVCNFENYQTVQLVIIYICHSDKIKMGSIKKLKIFLQIP
jgi:glycosyltransferase involved in cell wall biosynthesis